MDHKTQGLEPQPSVPNTTTASVAPQTRTTEPTQPPEPKPNEPAQPNQLCQKEEATAAVKKDEWIWVVMDFMTACIH